MGACLPLSRMYCLLWPVCLCVVCGGGGASRDCLRGVLSFVLIVECRYQSYILSRPGRGSRLVYFVLLGRRGWSTFGLLIIMILLPRCGLSRHRVRPCAFPQRRMHHRGRDVAVSRRLKIQGVSVYDFVRRPLHS